MKRILCALTCIFAVFFAVACNDDDSPVLPTVISVSLDLNGGEIEGPRSYTVEYGKNLIIEQPTKHGHEFIGWSYNGEIISLEPFAIAEYAVKIKAEWREKPCTITLNAEGGTLAGAQTLTVTPSDDIVIESPTREGYNFVGWTYNGGFIDLQTFDVSELYDVTFRAVWQAKTYGVTVNFNGGYVVENGAQITSKLHTLTYNGAINLPTPEKYGYNFNGYKINGDYIGSVWNYDITNAEIVADWVPIYVNYKINSNGANSAKLNGVDAVIPTSGIINYGASTSIVTQYLPIKTGYDFIGWYVNNEPIKQEFIYQSLTKIEIVAKYKPKQYSVTLNAGEGSLTGNTTYVINYGEEIEFEVPVVSEDKTFIGYKTESGDLISTNSGFAVYNYEYGGELIAEYTTKLYLIFIHYDGEIELVEIVEGVDLTEDDIPSPKQREGYNVNWSHEDVCSIIETTEIKAVCVPRSTSVEFDGKYQDLREIYSYGTVVTLPDETGKVKGYDFLGWSTSKTDTENVIKGEYLWDINKYNLTLYAIHIPKTYKIVYDTSAISVENYLISNGERVGNVQYVKFGEEYTLYTPVVKDNLLSVSWMLSGKQVADSGVWNTVGDVVLTAKTKINSVSVSITIDVNGGNGRKDAVITLNEKFSTISNLPIAPEGYKLVGFSYKGNFYSLSDVWDIIDYDGTSLVAMYSVSNVIKLKVDVNGGTGSTLVKLNVGEKLSKMSPIPTAPNGYYLKGFMYKGEFLSLDYVWQDIEYDYVNGEPLIAVYEDDDHLWN